MPRLEAYRKQAKQLVRWHREGNHSIGGRIRGLPRYQNLTDVQALQLKFPLSEAQEIIARNVKALFEEYLANDVPFVATLHKEAWGGPTCTVRDPDDNWICFSAA